jgi:hypothetical protein
MATESNIIPTAVMGNTLMTYVKLNGKNYVYWAQLVEIFLKGKGLYDHLTSGKPSEDSSASR